MDKSSNINELGEGNDTIAAAPSRVLQRATPGELASYIFEANTSFRLMAEAKGFDFLTYLIEMVIIEAARIRDQ
jgi:hypothetical protein